MLGRDDFHGVPLIPPPGKDGSNGAVTWPEEFGTVWKPSLPELIFGTVWKSSLPPGALNHKSANLFVIPFGVEMIRIFLIPPRSEFEMLG